MVPDSTTLVILWYPSTDEIRCERFTEWMERNRSAFYDGKELEECVPVFFDHDSSPERVADIALNMVRHRESSRARKAC